MEHSKVVGLVQAGCSTELDGLNYGHGETCRLASLARVLALELIRKEGADSMQNASQQLSRIELTAMQGGYPCMSNGRWVTTSAIGSA